MSTSPRTHTKSRRHRPSLGRTLRLLLESKASSAVIRGEVTGQAAEGWHDLLEAAKHLGFSQDHLLALLIQHSYSPVLKALQCEIDTMQAKGSSLNPLQA